MSDVRNQNDIAYIAIVEKMDRDVAVQSSFAVVDDLRRLAKLGHVESMNLLAVILGDTDHIQYRNEIVDLYTKSHTLGSAVAAENLAKQYRQWNEPLLAKMWARKAEERAQSLS